MRGYFFGSGVVLAFLYLIAAAFLIRLFGVELIRYWSTLMLAAGVLLGATYGLVTIVFVVVYVIRRVANRHPIMDPED